MKPYPFFYTLLLGCLCLWHCGKTAEVGQPYEPPLRNNPAPPNTPAVSLNTQTKSTSADAETRSPTTSKQEALVPDDPLILGPLVALWPPGAGAEPIRVKVEIADTPQKRSLGLMYRQALDWNSGMLFLFPQSDQLAFWMRNTFIPLDMIFITENKKVLGIVANTVPKTDTSRSVPGLSQYVLEVNAGFAQQKGIVVGTRVDFVDVPAAPAY